MTNLNAKPALSEAGLAKKDLGMGNQEYSTLDSLSASHYRALQSSAISDDVIRERGYRTITALKELRDLGFSQCSTAQVPGPLLPLHSVEGDQPFHVYRPDNPRTFDDKKGKRNPDCPSGSRKGRRKPTRLPAPGCALSLFSVCRIGQRSFAPKTARPNGDSSPRRSARSMSSSTAT